MENLTNFVTYFDLIGPLPTLKFNGKNRIGSIYGGIISILAYFAVIFMAGYFISDFVNSVTYNVIESDSESEYLLQTLLVFHLHM